MTDKKTENFERELKDKKAEAWDLRMQIDVLNIQYQRQLDGLNKQYQQNLSPLEANLNALMQEMEKINQEGKAG